MAVFDTAVSKLLKREGGYVFDPKDRGGETKYGISKASYPSVDIKSLTLDEARAIYLRDYWNPLRLSEFKDQNLAELLLDTAANMGTKTAALYLQRAAKALGQNIGADGKVGPMTLKAVHAISAASLASEIVTARASRYQKIVLDDPSQKKFLKGWLSRMKEYAPKGVKVAGMLLAVAIGILILSRRSQA
jgi:lysozyme family protein